MFVSLFRDLVVLDCFEKRERNEKTADIADVFPESEALRAYRAKWTARPFAKTTEHSTAYANWGSMDPEALMEKYK